MQTKTEPRKYTSIGHIYRTHENYGEAYFYTDEQRESMSRDIRGAFPDLEKFEDGDQFYSLEKNGEVIGCYSVIDETGSNNRRTGKKHIDVYRLRTNNSNEYFEQVDTDYISIEVGDDPEKIAIGWLDEV